MGDDDRRKFPRFDLDEKGRSTPEFVSEDGTKYEIEVHDVSKIGVGGLSKKEIMGQKMMIRTMKGEVLLEVVWEQLEPDGSYRFGAEATVENPDLIEIVFQDLKHFIKSLK